MSSLSPKQEQLRQLIDEQQRRIRQTFPAQRDSAVVALTCARDWHFLTRQASSEADGTSVVRRQEEQRPSLFFSGWHKALQLCFGGASEPLSGAAHVLDSTLDAWADQLLLACDGLAAGEQVLAYSETGFMRMQQGGQQDFTVWIASKRMPTEWRERADIAW